MAATSGDDTSRAGEVLEDEEARFPDSPEIERLYDHIIALAREQPLVDTSARDAEIERSYAKLLELQKKDAARFLLRFEESLDMPIDAGEKILSRLRALREEL